jgi:hypothetical protein
MLGMIALAIGMVIASNAIRDGMESRTPRDTIVVAGSARQPVEADQISWKLSLTSRQSTAEKTIGELDRWYKRIDAFMRERDIKRNEITMSPVELGRTSTADSEGNREFVGFTATRSLRVESTRLDAVETMATRSDELIASGIPIEASSPEFVYTKLSKHRTDMIEQAGEDAKRRAERLANVGDADLGRVKDVDVGDFQVTARRGTNFESGGSFDRQSRHKDIVIVVHLTFELR